MRNFSLIPYAIIGAVFVASALAAFFIEPNTVLTYILSLPASTALYAGLLQLLRDQRSSDQAHALQAAQNGFIIGATSHMANVAFDKHVSLSEEYVCELYKTLRTLFREGPTAKALGHANTLSQVREKYAVWLPLDLDQKLRQREAALRKLGANARFVEHQLGSDAHQRAVANMFREFAALLGRENMGADSWEGEKLEEDEAIEKVIARFRDVLGAEDLAKLRIEFIKRAIENL